MPRKSYMLFSEMKPNDGADYKQGDIIRMQILKMCNVSHPFYGEIKVDQVYFNNLIGNYNAWVPAQDIPVNEEHGRTRAQARFTGLEQEGSNLFGNLKLTKEGADNLNGAHYKYFSVEVYDTYLWQEDSKTYKNVLVGGAFTNYPFFKGMKKVVASDPGNNDNQVSFYFSNSLDMNRLKELLAKSKTGKLAFAEKSELMKLYNEVSEDEQKEVATDVEEAIETPKEVKEEEKKTEEVKTPEAQEHSDPEKVQMKKEIADLKQAQRFSEVDKKFSSFEVVKSFSQSQELLQAFAQMDATNETLIFSFLTNVQKVFSELTKGQLSGQAVKTDDGKTMKNGKEVVSDKAFSEKVVAYAKEKNVSETQAYSDIIGNYIVE